MLKKIKSKLGRNIFVHRIYEILYNPLNKGFRLELFFNYLSWHLYHRPFRHNLTIQLQNGMKSIVYPDSDSGVTNLFTKNVDFYENEFVRKVLSKGDFIIDVGCNVGNRTLALADIIRGALLIDANEICINRLELNLALNNISLSNFNAISKAVGREIRLVSFTDLGGTNCLNRIVNSAMPNMKMREIPMTTIDFEMNKLGNPECAYIKTDLEGYDLDALVGAEKTLKSESLKLVKFERWPNRSFDSFSRFFKNLDFKLFAIDDQGAPTFDKKALYKTTNLFGMPKKYIERLKAINVF
jgi:FkbM family methyltransferase